MPVKDSLETTRDAIQCLYQSTLQDWHFTLYNDFSSPENTEELKRLAVSYGFELVNWEEHTSHPSPNYLLTLQHAQAAAIGNDVPLVIVESDVLVRPDTLQRLLDAANQYGAGAEDADLSKIGMVAAVTEDEEGNVNFPYLFARNWKKKPCFTEKRFSFCCTLLSLPFLKAYSFTLLNPEKNWFDVTISHQSIEMGFRNLLLMDSAVLHKPHSSRPWKQLKYTNPLKYYFLKLFLKRDKI